MAEPVLLDLDGTLVDNTYHHALAWQRAFADHALVIPLWRVHRSVGMGGDKLVGAVAGEEVEERLGDELRQLWARHYAQLAEEVRPLPGASALVADLTDHGHPVAVASSGEPRFAEHGIELLGIGHLLDLVTTSADVEDSKPDPDLLGVTMRKLGVEHAVMVGDTPYDAEAAARAGIPCVGVRSGGFSQAELTDAGAVLVRDHVGDLVGLDWASLPGGG